VDKIIPPSSLQPSRYITPPIPKPSPKKPAHIQLRRTPVNPLPVDAVQQMLRDKNFYDKYDNASGKGITHQYESVERHGAKLVSDHATGLTWQQGGSEKYLSFKDVEAYIGQLNAKNYGGYTDWRLPTLEEAMSLMEPKVHEGLYIDPVFDRTQTWIWTADLESAGRVWCVDFNYGSCDHLDVDAGFYVRAVRS